MLMLGLVLGIVWGVSAALVLVYAALVGEEYKALQEYLFRLIVMLFLSVATAKYLFG